MPLRDNGTAAERGWDEPLEVCARWQTLPRWKYIRLTVPKVSLYRAALIAGTGIHVWIEPSVTRENHILPRGCLSCQRSWEDGIRAIVFLSLCH